MLTEANEVFKMELSVQPERWFFDNYTLKDGTYVLLNMEKEFSVETILSVKTDKKSGKTQGEESKWYPFFCYVDYFSKLIEMNKPMDTKKQIHSNNMYSFFVKKEKLLSNELTEACIDGYYQTLLNPKKKYKAVKDRKVYEAVEEKYGTVDENDLEKIYHWVKDEFWTFLQKNEESLDLEKKEYLKLFFVGNDIEESKRKIGLEGKRYLEPNIFNKNAYNEQMGDKIFGLPTNNISLNDKKPFLKNKSRKIQVPHMVTVEEALKQAELFDYLSSQAAKGKYNVYINLDPETANSHDYIKSYKNGEGPSDIITALYLRIQQDKELQIKDSCIVTGFHTKLKRPFYMREIFQIPEKMEGKTSVSYGVITELKGIEGLVHDVFFKKILMQNYYTDSKNISEKNSMLKHTLLIYRERLWKWFYGGDETGMQPILKGIALETLRNSFSNGYEIKMKHQMNLYVSLMDYFNNDRRLQDTMVEARQFLRETIDSNREWDFESDAQYFYAVGQLFAIFLSKSKAKKKEMSMINPILKTKKDTFIKTQITRMFEKYNYDMDYDRDKRIRRILGHVMGYQPQKEVDTTMLIAGFVDDNVLYQKKQEGGVENENE